MKEAFEQYGSIIVLSIVGIALIVGFKEILDYFLMLY